jgi:hypothetical protein
VAVVNDVKVLGLGKWNYWIWRQQQKKCRRRLHHGGSNGSRSYMMIIAKYDLDCAVCTSNDGLRAFYAEAI